MQYESSKVFHDRGWKKQQKRNSLTMSILLGAGVVWALRCMTDDPEVANLKP